MARLADRHALALVTAGTAVASAMWRGGFGTLFVDNVSGTPTFQYSRNGTDWYTVESPQETPLTELTNGHYPFMLPASTLLRMSAGGGSMNVEAIGV